MSFIKPQQNVLAQLMEVVFIYLYKCLTSYIQYGHVHMRDSPLTTPCRDRRRQGLARRGAWGGKGWWGGNPSRVYSQIGYRIVDIYLYICIYIYRERVRAQEVYSRSACVCACVCLQRTSAHPFCHRPLFAPAVQSFNGALRGL